MTSTEKKNTWYSRWIHSNLDKGSIREPSLNAAHKMVTIFPELIICRGYIILDEPMGLYPSKLEHHWCVSPEGEIIDPQENLFSNPILKYIEI